MERFEILAQSIEKYIDDILSGKSGEGLRLWRELAHMHPADIAHVLDNTKDDIVISLFQKMDLNLATHVFDKLSEPVQILMISQFDNEELAKIFRDIPTDRLTTIFEHIPEKELSRYLKLTHKKRRQKIASSLKCEDKTAGRMLNSDVLTLHKELTVKKVISILQQHGPNVEIYPSLYVTDADLKLIGYIEISDLLKNNPLTKIEKILKSTEATAHVDDDQEEVAEVIKRFDLLSIPVTDEHGHFLGIISANDVIEIIEEEMTEDSYKMSGLAPTELSYTQTGFWTIIVQRSKWLIPLLLFQSFAAVVVNQFEVLLSKFGLVAFLTMLVGTGGNVGNQSATFIVRGLATGEINRKNKFSVFIRETLMSFALGFILALVALVRVVIFNTHIPSMITIIVSLFCIIITSVTLGTLIPLVLDAWDIDPANSAAPFLATLMDIIGITIYCVIANVLLA